jgi:Zn finger protein HypA/HybF involved in hydrogenase expression
MELFKCLSCKKEHTTKKNHMNMYCNNTCQQDYKFLKETLPKFKKGEISNRRTLHRCLKETKGYVCVSCNNNGMYNNMPLSLQLDHIDGNAGNNDPKNLRLLCPNCHSQTETFVAKNKGNGRGSRGLKR